MNAQPVERKAIMLTSAMACRNPSQELPIVETKLQIGRGRDSRKIIHPKRGYVLDKH